jgi:hypothetical protein
MPDASDHRFQMPAGQITRFRFGGIAFLVSGTLFLLRELLDIMTGPPPSTGAGILVWVDANRLALSLVSEVLFFAAISLVPAVIALYSSLARTPQRMLAAIGCGIVAVVVPILGVLLIVHGRLVFPVFGLRITSPAVAELTVALFFGGVHAVELLMGVATFVLSLAMRRSAFGVPTVALGFATAVGDVVGSYPDLISPVVLLGCRLLSVAWFLSVGRKLLTIREQGAPIPGTG